MNKLIGIIGAMDIEIEGILASMTDITSEKISQVTFYKGKISDKSIVIAKCGIGKVFAAMCAQAMILNYNPSVIINTGVAGTLSEKLSILDIAVAKSVVQHDMDTSAIGDPVGFISGINVVDIFTDDCVVNALKTACDKLNYRHQEGTIASGDKFISDNLDKERIKNTFGAIACEMEGAAIGQVCYVNGIKFGVLRAISDGEGAEMDYSTFAPIAAKHSIEIIKKFIEIY